MEEEQTGYSEYNYEEPPILDEMKYCKWLFDDRKIIADRLEKAKKEGKVIIYNRFGKFLVSFTKEEMQKKIGIQYDVKNEYTLIEKSLSDKLFNQQF